MDSLPDDHAMRKIFKRILPGHEAVRDNRWLRIFGKTLLHPALWHLTRNSAAGGLAAGLFCGLIPGPFQMLFAAIAAIIFRINLPLALIATLYTNPLTIVPLYILAFELGRWVTGSDGQRFVPPPEIDWTRLGDPFRVLFEWIVGMGQPLAVGLPLLAVIFAIAGYALVQLLWRLQLLRYLQRRRARTAAKRAVP
jgi:uncharacterized protein